MFKNYLFSLQVIYFFKVKTIVKKGGTIVFYRSKINPLRKIVFIISITILCLLTLYVQRGNTQIMPGYQPFTVTARPFFPAPPFPPFPVTAPPLYTAARTAAVLLGTSTPTPGGGLVTTTTTPTIGLTAALLLGGGVSTTTLALLAATTPTVATTPTPTFFPTAPTPPTVTPTIGTATLLLLGGGTSTTTLLALGI